MWTVFKVFVKFVTGLLLFNALGFLAARHVGPWLPDQGWNPRPLHWKARLIHWARRGVPGCAFVKAELRPEESTGVLAQKRQTAVLPGTAGPELMGRGLAPRAPGSLTQPAPISRAPTCPGSSLYSPRLPGPWLTSPDPPEEGK